MKGNRKFRQLRNDDSGVANVVGTSIMLAIMVPIVGSVSFTFTNMMYQQREMMREQTVIMENFTEYMQGFKFNQGTGGNNSTTPYVEYEFNSTTRLWDFWYCVGHEAKWIKLTPDVELQTPKYTLTVIIIGRGNVTKNPLNSTYDSGTQVQISATPNAEWIFTSWYGDVTGSNNPTTITMNGNKAISAVFVSKDVS